MIADMDAQLVKVITPIIDLPGRLRYRETMSGKIETAELVKYADLLIAIRRTHRHISQSRMEAVLSSVAENMEGTWKLAGERPDYARRMARKLRAMLHDIQQNINKYAKDKR